MRNPALFSLLEAHRTQGSFSAAQAVVVHQGQLHHTSCHGALHPAGPPVTLQSRLDTASLTKVLATSTVAMVLAGQGELDLDTPVQRWLSAFRHTHITPRMLLGHRSGLAAWAPLFESIRQDPAGATLYPGDPGTRNFDGSTELMRQAVLAQDPISPPGPRLYSDIGFLILGMLLEVVGGAPLDTLARDMVFRPLDLGDTGYVRMQGNGVPTGEFVATGLSRPRPPAPGQESLYRVPPQSNSLCAGEVDDDNAYAMGGVAGHAGVFSTATDVAHFGLAILQEAQGQNRLAPVQVVKEFLKPDAVESKPVRSLGWDRPSGSSSTAGKFIGQGPGGAVGHLGFTGCSLWLDLDRQLVCALLTNRVFPTRANVAGIGALRPAFHDAVVEGLNLV